MKPIGVSSDTIVPVINSNKEFVAINSLLEGSVIGGETIVLQLLISEKLSTDNYKVCVGEEEFILGADTLVACKTDSGIFPVKIEQLFTNHFDILNIGKYVVERYEEPVRLCAIVGSKEFFPVGKCNIKIGTI